MRNTSIRIRATSEERELARYLSRITGLTTSDLIRRLLLEAMDNPNTLERIKNHAYDRKSRISR